MREGEKEGGREGGRRKGGRDRARARLRALARESVPVREKGKTERECASELEGESECFENSAYYQISRLVTKFTM